MKNNAVATVPAADAQIAAQLTDQYRKAIAGTREVLVFGAMMMSLGSFLSSQNAPAGNNQYTPREDTIKGWLEEFCPSINYKVAYGFYKLAKGLREALAIPMDTDVHRLLTAPEKSLSKKEAKIRALIDGAIDGKSARQLEFDFGIRKARAALPPAGGAREGAGRKPYSVAREQVELEAFFSDDAVGELASAVLEKRWHLRLDDEKKGLLFAIAERLFLDLGGKQP